MRQSERIFYLTIEKKQHMQLNFQNRFDNSDLYRFAQFSYVSIVVSIK